MRTLVLSMPGLLFLLLVIAGCKDDTENVLVSFDNSLCDGNLTLCNGEDSADYMGLQCIAWRLTPEGNTAIDFVHFMSGCVPPDLTVPWEGKAKIVGDDILALEVEWQFNSPNACGSCAYVWAFEVENVPAGETFDLKFTEKGCTECEGSNSRATLAAPTDTVQIECRYRQYWGGPEEYYHGFLFASPPCEDDLEVGVNADGDSLCMATCEEDSDCPLGDLLMCESSLCVLRDQLELVESWNP